MVRSTVEETLCVPGPVFMNGYCSAGELGLRFLICGARPLETAIIYRYRRRAISVEEALIDASGAHFGRRVEDNTETLWGTRAEPLLKH